MELYFVSMEKLRHKKMEMDDIMDAYRSPPKSLQYINLIAYQMAIKFLQPSIVALPLV